MRFVLDAEIDVAPEREYRQIPTARWASRLGVSRFDKIPEYIGEISADKVEIPLNRHIGIPAIACVTDGESIKGGFEIAAAADGLSVPYHAPIFGRVTLGIDKITIDKVM